MVEAGERKDWRHSTRDFLPRPHAVSLRHHRQVPALLRVDYTQRAPLIDHYEAWARENLAAIQQCYPFTTFPLTKLVHYSLPARAPLCQDRVVDIIDAAPTPRCVRKLEQTDGEVSFIGGMSSVDKADAAGDQSDSDPDEPVVRT